MAAPPIFRVFDLGKMKIIFRRIEQAAFESAARRCTKPKNESIEIAHAGFAFGDHAVGDLAARLAEKISISNRTAPLKHGSSSRAQLPRSAASRRPHLHSFFAAATVFIPFRLPGLLGVKTIGIKDHYDQT
jgi:hypothetical protein